ncbi:protein of unknown function [Paenibacillus algorifonticola]|uniref:DUF4280 domain-containing protein n=1 Tax=Paenibacillus algorifonticola TaxID=684063 RepID=A0A1I2BFF9_9BACL|nr:DUF4280 domain-containing protein [Paenibacillus algorifonticola]SFE54856.1 protein of unknown function [Paenibacillus algorifonticola]
MGDQPAYVVRGATMACTCGTHKRRINLPESHGSYVNGKPMMNEDDNGSENVPYFGICISPKMAAGQIVYLIDEEGNNIGGPPCMPDFMGKWLLPKENAKVDNKPALTTDSFLKCSIEGEVFFLSDGQHDSD